MSARRAAGFTLIEVLISVMVIAVGLLGIAKMQALAYSSTGIASLRSLAAIEASSLAASMHADRAYWANGVAGTTAITVTGTTISDANLAGVSTDCKSATGTPADCNPQTLAGYDLQQWAQSVQNLLPNPLSTIACTAVVNAPPACTITVTWSENTVSLNTQATGTLAGTPSYTLYVEP